MAAKKTNIPQPTTTNGFGGRNGHVSLARVEYDALVGREEVISELTAENAKLQARNIDLTQTIDMQAKHMSTFELKVMHLERITGLQSALIDIFKDKEKSLGIAELSDFWKQWQVATSNGIDSNKLDRKEVAKFEPDLFKMWRNWVNDYGKQGRTLNFAGTRAEIEAAQPETQAMLQTHMLALKNAENAKLRARVSQLEAELGALVPPEVKQP